MRHYYSFEDEEMIRKEYPCGNIKELANKLGRTSENLRTKAHDMGVKRVNILPEQDIIYAYNNYTTIDCIKNTFHTSYETLINILNKNLIPIRKPNETRNLKNEITGYKEFIVTKQTIYALGILHSIGTIKRNNSYILLDVIIDNVDILNNFLNIMKINKAIRYYDNRAQVKLYRADGMLNLIKFGYNSDLIKFKELLFPINISDEFISHYIRGYFENNCRIHGLDKNLYLTVGGNIDFLETLRIKLFSIGLSKMPQIYPLLNYYNLRIYPYNDVKQIINWIYKDSSEDTRLAHKYNIYNSYFINKQYKSPSNGIKWIDERHIQCSICNDIKDLNEFQKQTTFCNKCRQIKRNNYTDTSLENYMHDVLQRMKSRASLKNMPCLITVNDLINLYYSQDGKCFYTDEIMIYNRKKENYALSVDAIIPSLGYIVGNTVLAINQYNKSKRESTLEEIKNWSPTIWDNIKNHPYIIDILNKR